MRIHSLMAGENYPSHSSSSEKQPSVLESTSEGDHRKGDPQKPSLFLGISSLLSHWIHQMLSGVRIPGADVSSPTRFCMLSIISWGSGRMNTDGIG